MRATTNLRPHLSAFLVAFAAALPRAAPADDPAAPVREAYRLERALLSEARPGAAEGKARPPWAAPHRDRLFAERLAKLFATDERYAQATGDVGNLEVDPFLAAAGRPPGALRDLVIDVTLRRQYRAEVRARFTGAEGKEEIRFDVVREDDRWVVDEIRPRGWRWSAGRALSEPYPCDARWKERCAEPAR